MSETIKRVDILRAIYKAQAGTSTSSLDHSAKEAAVELKIANDLTTDKMEALSPLVKSPP